MQMHSNYHIGLDFKMVSDIRVSNQAKKNNLEIFPFHSLFLVIKLKFVDY